MHKASLAYRRTREVADPPTPSASITPPAELSQVLQNITTGSYFSALEDDERCYIFQMAICQAGLAGNNGDSDERMHHDQHSRSDQSSPARPRFTPEQMRTVAYVCEGLAQAHLYARDTLKVRILGPAILKPASMIVEEEQEIGDPDPEKPVNRTTVSTTVVTTEAPALAPTPGSTPTDTAIIKRSGEWLNFSELRHLSPMMSQDIFPACFMNALRGKHYLPLNMFGPDVMEDFLVGSSATRMVEVRDIITGSTVLIPDSQDFLETEDVMDVNEWIMAYSTFTTVVEECFGSELATMFRNWTRELSMHPLFHIDFPLIRRFDIRTRRSFFRCSKPFMLEAQLLEGLHGIDALAIKMRGYPLIIPPSPERPVLELDPSSPATSGFSPTQWPHNDRGPSAPSRQRIELPRKPYDREGERRVGERSRSLKFCVSCGQSSHLTRACREHVRAFGGDVLCTFDSGRLLLVGSDHHAQLCLRFNIRQECKHSTHHRDGAHRCSLCLGGDHPALSCPSNTNSSI